MATSAKSAEITSLRVWDPLVRVLHWTLVGGVALAWLTQDFQAAHQLIGYLVLAAIALRLIWGVAGSHYARFSQFLRSPAAAIAYARHVRSGTAPRFIGHNPLGGWMIMALLLTLIAIGTSGALLTSEAWWGNEWLEESHEAIASGMLLLIVAHVAGVIHASRSHGENLARAMITGVKTAAQPGDIA